MEGPYSAVEVWCVTGGKVTEFEYDEESPSPYVPIEQVVYWIDNHGGFATCTESRTAFKTDMVYAARGVLWVLLPV